jgi:hypothetical protein
MKSIIPLPLLFGLISGILFSVIDTLILISTKKELNEYLKIHFPSLNNDEIGILLGAIAGLVSILIANYIHHYISSKYNIMRHPLLDSMGIIVGVVVVIGLYELYKKHIRHKDKR